MDTPTTPPATTPAPPTPPAPAADRRRRTLLLAGAAVLAAAVVGLGILLATRGGGTPDAAAPTPAPTPAASTEPAPQPTATPTPTPATPQEQAAADLQTLVRDYRATEDKVYLDPALDPSAAFDPYLRWPASEESIARVLDFRREGNRMDSTATEVHSVQVTALDLAADPATATVVECKTLTAAGADGEGQPQSGTNPRVKVVWTAKTIPTGGWRLYSNSGSEGENSC